MERAKYGVAAGILPQRIPPTSTDCKHHWHRPLELRLKAPGASPHCCHCGAEEEQPEIEGRTSGARLGTLASTAEWSRG